MKNNSSYNQLAMQVEEDVFYAAKDACYQSAINPMWEEKWWEDMETYYLWIKGQVEDKGFVEWDDGTKVHCTLKDVERVKRDYLEWIPIFNEPY